MRSPNNGCEEDYSAPRVELIFTMWETFEWVKLLVVQFKKDGLEIPVKISLGK